MIRGPSGVSSATSTGMLSSHSLAMTRPRIRAGSVPAHRIRSSAPGGRGAISIAVAVIRCGKEDHAPPSGGGGQLLRQPEDLAQQFALACPDVHQVEPVRVAERLIGVAEQGQDGCCVAWRDVHRGPEVRRRAFPAGVEAVPAVQRILGGGPPCRPHEPTLVARIC